MTEINEQPLETTEMISIPLDTENRLTIEKLATWGKIVAVINIILGILNVATIFFLSIPTFVMGVFMILMGTNLNSTTAHLRYGIFHKDSTSIAMALNQLRLYMMYNGILLLMFVVLMAIGFIFLLTAGAAINEFMNEYIGTI